MTLATNTAAGRLLLSSFFLPLYLLDTDPGFYTSKMQRQPDPTPDLLDRSLQTIRSTEPQLAEVQDVIEVLNRNCAQLHKQLEETQEFSQQTRSQLDVELGHTPARDPAPQDTVREIIEGVCRKLDEKCIFLNDALRTMDATAERLSVAQATIADVHRNMNQLEQQVIAAQDIVCRKEEETKKELDKALDRNTTLQRALQGSKAIQDTEKEKNRTERGGYEREKRQLEEERRGLSVRVERLEQQNCALRTQQEEEQKLEVNIASLHAEDERKKRHIESLQRQLSEKEAACKCLLQNMAAMDAQRTQDRTANEDLNTKLNQLSQLRETTQAYADDCQTRNNALATRLAFWKATARMFFRNLVASRKEQRLSKTDQAQKDDRNTTLQRALNDLMTKTQREKMASEISAKQTWEQVECLQAEVHRLLQEVQETDCQLQEAHSTVLSRDAENASLRGEMANIILQVTGLTSTTQALSEQLGTMAGAKEVLKNQVMALRQEKADLQLQLTQAASQNNDLRRQAEAEAARLRELAGMWQLFQRQAAPLQKEMEKFRQEVQRLEGQLQEAINTVRSRDEEIKSLRDAVCSRDAALEDSRARECDLETVLRASCVHVWRYQAEVDEGRKTIRELERELRHQSFRVKSSSFADEKTK